MDDLGFDRVHSRRIRLFDLSRWEWQKPDVELFTLLVAARAPADDGTVLRIRSFAAEAIAAGCAYVCAWGDGCELVHDVFDDVSIAADRFVMSTWHENDSLAGALYFALVNTLPGYDQFPNAPESVVVLAVEEPWLEEVRRLIADQPELARLWVAEDE